MSDSTIDKNVAKTFNELYVEMQKTIGIEETHSCMALALLHMATKQNAEAPAFFQSHAGMLIVAPTGTLDIDQVFQTASEIKEGVPDLEQDSDGLDEPCFTQDPMASVPHYYH